MAIAILSYFMHYCVHLIKQVHALEYGLGARPIRCPQLIRVPEHHPAILGTHAGGL